MGYSGHAYVVIDTLESLGYVLHGYLEKIEVQDNPFKLSYLGFENEQIIRELSKQTSFALGIGDNSTRVKIAKGVLKFDGEIVKVIHPSAVISQSSGLGIGTFVAGGAVINAFAEVGDFSIVNTGAIVEHECRIGEAVHVAPGAVLLGNVQVGDRSFLGGRSVVKQGVKIGSDVIVGAGAVVVKDIVQPGTYVGNPARKLVK